MMSNNDRNQITSLLEERIRDQVKGDVSAALGSFELTIDEELRKLRVFAPNVHSFVADIRARHIDNEVARRVNALVERLVSE